MKQNTKEYLKGIFSICICLIIHLQSSGSEQKKGFVITGDISGLKDGSTVCLVTYSNDTLAKAISNGSRFTLRGRLKNETDFYFLSIDTALYPLKGDKLSNTLWLVNSKMRLTGKISDFKNLLLEGSEVHNDWEKYKKLQDQFSNISKWPVIPEVEQFISKHRNSLFVPIILRQQPPEVQNEAYLKLTRRVKKSADGIQLAKLIERNKDVIKFARSGRIPDFRITAADGKSTSIYALAAQNKYTLIDFWASWCGPCRASFPKLGKVYEAYHNKGFSIVGISLDEAEADWKKALNEDKTPWFHGLDNLENASRNIFGLTGVPSYVLIDHQGKIIQSQLMGAAGKEHIQTFKEKSLPRDLYEIIEELLKEEARRD